MDLSKLTYSKKDLQLSPKDEPKESRTNGRSGGHFDANDQNVSMAYQKPESAISTKLVYVLSGGEVKERKFLLELIDKHSITSLKVLFMSKEHQGLQPYQMQEAWNAIIQSKEINISGTLYHLEEMDRVYLLSDVDEFYDQLVKIKCEKKEDDNSNWIISNPCFEIWLYYCYKNAPKQDWGRLEALDVKKRSKEMKKMENTVVNGGLNPILAFEKLPEGIRNSAENYFEDEKGIPGLFATQMHMMAQYLIDIMNEYEEEYSNLIKVKEEKRMNMRKLAGLDVTK